MAKSRALIISIAGAGAAGLLASDSPHSGNSKPIDEHLDRRDCAPAHLCDHSHPDAGKTTLTEKLLLFDGAIQLAGEVKAIGGGCARIGWRSSASAASRSPRR